MSGGTWLKRDVDVHRCPKPHLKTDAPLATYHDVWACNTCGAQWEVVGFDSGMQWDPYPTVIQWKQLTDKERLI